MVTIRDVAKESGVSVATVSRVLNQTGYVHEDTRKKVMAAVDNLKYSPNEVARSLYKKKSKLIGLLLPDITNPFFPQLARGVEDEMQKGGYRLLFGNSDENAEKEMDYLNTFIQNNVVGIISATNNKTKTNYKDLSIPVVFLDRTSSDYPSVYADGKEGGRIAAEEIVKRGSKRITLLKGPAHIQPAQDRFQGALEALSQSTVDFHVMSTTSFAFEDAEKWAKELFATYPDTDGVLASNDIVATAVLHEALRLGKSIPEDLQIIGFDDIPQSSLLFPSLSTIRQPAYEMGKEAATLLVKLINKENVQQQHIQMPVTFIDRNTTREVDAHG
ncbi:LacI family DNA-binding transcriptional regulator [Fictibacillus barbaricus]|uniref:LacI family DNA-binding transcriptional regulator n=1 Tax=Fictibacillus barbaricus TaxID=182136 RepID=A0ABS2ZG92_9BACL|nr:LacI family DNA-binding transcriptional regulator [Fictibacillus barbaricus]MBN3546358.1 LacI family DNA-binding transcriptional regulator [Fictibacillus barbaricus]GGB40423.1 ribose operon repressor [Fictibacillus barbaricus]